MYYTETCHHFLIHVSLFDVFGFLLTLTHTPSAECEIRVSFSVCRQLRRHSMSDTSVFHPGSGRNVARTMKYRLVNSNRSGPSGTPGLVTPVALMKYGDY